MVFSHFVTAEEEQVFQVCVEDPPSGMKYVVQEPQGPLVFFDLTAAACSYWNTTKERWAHDGCEVCAY